MARCALADQKAFARLYELTSPKLYGIARYCLQREGLADEVIQEAYIRIWRKAGQYNAAKSSAMTWMISITRHCAIDLLRGRRHEQGWDDEALLESVADERQGPEGLFSSQQGDSALNDCLSQLNTDQRKCIVLTYFKGASMTDLAQELMRPAGTVKSWVRRGLLKLRECLHEIY